MNLTPTVDIYELVWSIIAGFGFCVACYYVFDARRDRYVQQMNDGDAATIALSLSHIINAISKAIAFLLYFCLGVYLMTREGPLTITGASLAIRFILIGGQILVFSGMAFNQVMRKRILTAESRLAADRLKDATERAAMELAANTAALHANTEAIKETLPSEWDKDIHKDRRITEREGEDNDASG